MSNKIVYLVRHGETDANAMNRVQGFAEPLSAIGRKQAMTLAERCTHLTFDALIASDMARTKETADFISKKTSHKIILEPLFREIIRPTMFEGIDRNSDEYQTFLANEITHLDDPGWNYFEGEMFTAISKQALDALTDLEKRPEERLVVISHGIFIRCLAATVLTQKNLTTAMWRHLSQTLQMHNTGITILKYDVEKNDWVLRTWNDHAHFAE